MKELLVNPCKKVTNDLLAPKYDGEVISGLCVLDNLLLEALFSWKILFSWFPWHRAGPGLIKHI